MSKIILRCRDCKTDTPHNHMHDAPYGIEGTHMAGSERFTCEACGHNIFIGDVRGTDIAKLFILDV